MSHDYTAVDVAEDIMQTSGQRLSAKKVQKLLYYSHVIHLARHQEPLVVGGFQAWRDGPVSYAVYDRQRGDAAPTTVNGRPDRLSADAKESVRIALELYGDRSGSDLVALSHGDGPWTLARGEVPAGAISQNPISDETIVKVLVPTVSRLLAAREGRRFTLEEFEAEFAS